jgi:DNA-binding SARP family transcriptional activator
MPVPEPGDSGPSLAIFLFGPFEARVHGAPLPRLRSRKGQWLLALLALRAGATLERAWLAGTLWPDSPETQALASLRMALTDLRGALGAEAGRVSSPTPQTLRLDLKGAEADVLSFDRAMARGDPVGLEEAVGLYRGPLLDGCAEEWVFQERQPREQAYLGALETLAAQAMARGDPEAAERQLRRAVTVDPLRESTQRALMQALAEAGNYAAALHTYRELRLRLHRELHAEPDPETTALFGQIREEARRRASGASPARPSTPSAPTTAAPSPDLTPDELEIAHVLCMDIVGYARLPIEQQPRLLRELQELIRGTEEFRRAEGGGELISLPTGDGMALVFFRGPVAPVQCAMQISRALRDRAHLPMRMGLHTGPVYRVEDINANSNVSGGGINLAQRVMDCGDAGHILLSSAIRELLRQVGDWPVYDLGECDVKHGERLHLFSLHTDELGNPALPEKLRASVGVSRRPEPKPGPRETRGEQVALLYKRHAQPDEHLLKLLETQLKSHGFRVFIDRHLEIGVEWAREIERQIRGSDAVVPLLSTASVSSEMLQYEVQIAHEAAQQQNGKPRLLPIRIRDTGPLPEGLAAILDPLEYALWQGPDEDERLVSELLRALESPQIAPATLPRVSLEATAVVASPDAATMAPADPTAKLEPVGGAVPLDSPFYVVRPADADFHAAIARKDSIVLVKGARQMGKTSLLARGLHQARSAGSRVLLTDFQLLNAAHLESADALLRGLAEWIAAQLDLDVGPEEVWNPRRGPSINFQQYFRRQVLDTIGAPIVWGLDEVDRLFTCDFGSEIFGMFRSWHNARSLDPTGPWAGLTLAMAYATEAHLFITDVNQSPFNVGTRLTLDDFSAAQVADLNERYGRPLREADELERYYALVGGHPYLVRRGLHEMVTHGLGLAGLAEQADGAEGIFGDHLRRMLVLLVKDPTLCDAVRDVIRGQPCPTPESFYRLRGAGVLVGDSARSTRPRCRLYAAYLERHLL